MQKPTIVTLMLLFVTASLLSRAMFYFIDDPEGPNLLVVGVMGLVVLGVSLVVSRFVLGVKGRKQPFNTILIQIALVTVAYFLLR